MGLQMADGPHDGVVGQIQFLFGAARGNKGIGAQQVHHLECDARVRLPGQRVAPALDEPVQALPPAVSVLGLAGHAIDYPRSVKYKRGGKKQILERQGEVLLLRG